MNQDELQQKLDQASRHYNDGQYDEAMAVWKGILQDDPENERAREGLQMVELLTQDFATPAEEEAKAVPMAADAVQVQEAVERVQDLLDSGELDAAREGVEVLLQIAPEDPAVQRCAARLEAGADPSAFIAEQLSLARHYVMMEEPAAGIEACRRVLSLDPDNDEAKELLSQARGGEAPPSQSSPGPPAPTSQATPDLPAPDQPLGEDDLLTFDLDSLEDASDPPAAPEPTEAEPSEIPQAPVLPGDAESAHERIATLLAQGDQLEAQGDLQGAIQIWSRVFILEDSHPGAEERVDRVRRVLEEQAVRVDEMRFRAEDLMRAGSLTEAREEYRKVLEVLPHHQEAKEALEQIERKLAGGDADAADEGKGIQAVPLALPEEPQEAAPVEVEGPVLLEPQPQTPPPAPPVAAPPAPARRGPSRVLVLSVLVAGVIVLGAAGYFGWQILFPSGPSGELQALEPQPLDRTSAAPPAAATEPAAPQPEAAVEEDPSPPVPPRRTTLSDAEAHIQAKQVVEEGMRLFDDGEYAMALEQFREALDLDPGNMDAKDGETKAATEVERREAFRREIATIRAAIDDHDYETALKKLYRTQALNEAGEAMAQRWIVTCWYNWGVLRLQGARLSEAEEKFREVLELEPGDEETANHLEVVRRYHGRPVDATFKNYASRVKLRALE